MAGFGREIIVAVLGAAAVGAATLAWNWASSGGVVEALGGVTKAKVEEMIKKIPGPVPPVSDLKISVRDSTPVVVYNNKGSAGAGAKCDQGMIVGGACNLVNGRGRLYNSGYWANEARCTWGDTDDGFVGHVIATCLHIEKK